MTKYETATQEILECKKQGITAKRTIAKLLLSKNPELFSSIENARSCVRGVLGVRGAPVSKNSAKVIEVFKEAVDSDYDKARQRPTVKTKHYIITSAVNNTPVFKPFWDNLIAYSKYLNAEVYVIAMRYRNPTSVFSDAKDDFWCTEVLPYLDANRHIIHSTVEIMSDVKIQPTSSNPLMGMEGLSGEMSCIFGHPRVHMKYLPVLKGSKPKIMQTTGVCTLSNYTDSGIGKKGDFHHTYGFTIVTIQSEEKAVIRYCTARSDGDFIDLDIEVSKSIVHKADSPKALILGDIHASKLTPTSIARIHHEINTLNPKVVVLHDVFDGQSINPHEAKDSVELYRKMSEGKNNLEKEIDEAVSFIKSVSDIAPEVVVVNSNHDRFLDRYITNMDWRKDMFNAKICTELTLKALNSSDRKGLFAQIVAERLPKVVYLNIDESYLIDDIEAGCHGDIGSNGSKGSPNQFRRLSTKTVTGHTHSPSRTDGGTVVGCQDLDHGYNVGMSSWGLADVVINSDGKRQHILH